ncbi:hypothetical protein MVEN_02467700 [Mycena venus]|uniref:Uncharacterized protein n=1 Tax=Mycena venus TaxID=2733690 RepID=A0A8H7CCB0_9AGAR|nr:hypothetical protein MVEN_02467700 [Mycena venus]
MDANFTFPAPESPTASNRESNALRASVLDAALELGLGANGSVANWMFNNAVEEEEDEEDTTSKGPLSATSDEYGNYSYSTPATSTSSHQSHSETSQPNLKFQVHFPPGIPVTAISRPPPFAFPEPPPPPSSSGSGGNKLRKARRADGYESDGGYVSDGGKRVRTKSKTAKEDVPTMPISEPMELIPLSKEERKRRKKELKSSSKDHGAETDVEEAASPNSKKSKPPKPSKKKKDKQGSTDVGYETDDGYVSSSGKKSGRSRFFSLRRKATDTNEAPPMPEPVPELPSMPEFDLPIASRFATTLDGGSGSAAPSRSETPLLPPSRPFASGGSSAPGSSASSISSSANSLLTPADGEAFPGSGSEVNSRAHSPLPSSNSTGSGNGSANGKGKFMISFPLTRTGSAGSGESASNAIPKGRHVPAPISTLSPGSALNSRAPSPGPSPIAGSPFVVLTPINTNTASNSYNSNASGHLVRAISPSPSTATDNIIPSPDYIVPSRSVSPPPALKFEFFSLCSAERLGILQLRRPAAEPAAYGTSAARTGPAAECGWPRERRGGSRCPVNGRSVSPSPTAAGGMTSPLSPSGGGSGSALLSPHSPGSAGGLARPVSPGAGVQRGRAAPFPMQPVSGSRPGAGAHASIGPGLASRAKVQRYRDLYAIQIPATPQDGNARRRARFADDDEDDEEVGIRVEDYDDDGREEDEEEADEEEMRQVLGRFRDPTAQREEKGRRMAIALERNNSGALRAGTGRPIRPTSDVSYADRFPRGGAYTDDDEASRYPDEDRTAGRSTMYRVERGDGRDTMRWSGYTDTRASFLDVEKSEQARGALVDRVGAMYDLSGRERPAVPPVPKLPAGLVMAGPGGNRF